jgi:cell wall-associated NlpC family hydrolase
MITHLMLASTASAATANVTRPSTHTRNIGTAFSSERFGEEEEEGGQKQEQRQGQGRGWVAFTTNKALMQPHFIHILLAWSITFFQWGTAQGQLSPSFNSTSWDGKLSITFPKHPPKHPTPFTHQGMATFGDDCSGLKLYVFTCFVDRV